MNPQTFGRKCFGQGRWSVSFDHNICDQIDRRDLVGGHRAQLFVLDGQDGRARTLDEGGLHLGIVEIESSDAVFGMNGTCSEDQEIGTHARDFSLRSASASRSIFEIYL